MTEYYRISNGHTLMHPDGYKLGEDGDVIALDTDAKDKTQRKAAVAVLNGNWNIVTKTSKPKGKKRSTYKRKDMKAETPEAPEATAEA